VRFKGSCLTNFYRLISVAWKKSVAVLGGGTSFNHRLHVPPPPKLKRFLLSTAVVTTGIIELSLKRDKNASQKGRDENYRLQRIGVRDPLDRGKQIYIFGSLMRANQINRPYRTRKGRKPSNVKNTPTATPEPAKSLCPKPSLIKRSPSRGRKEQEYLLLRRFKKI